MFEGAQRDRVTAERPSVTTMQLEQTTRLTHELERIVLARIEADRLVVPSMPVIATRCLALLRDPDFATRKLVIQLEADPVLAALALRQANSAANGTAVKLLDQAVTRLGAEAMKVLVTSYAAHQLFQSTDRRIAQANKRIWEHSVAVALLSRDLATAAGSGEADVCYLGGLLHDVGKPVLASMMLEAERKLGAGRAGWIDHAAWVDAVGAAHRRVGTAVATQWNLPAEVTAAIRDCSDYDADDRACAANVVRLANALAKREGLATGPARAEEVDAMIEEGRAMIGVRDDVLAQLVDGLQSRVTQALG
jgi:putative nucleotidyltransferase with HDIG domain